MLLFCFMNAILDSHDQISVLEMLQQFKIMFIFRRISKLYLKTKKCSLHAYVLPRKNCHCCSAFEISLCAILAVKNANVQLFFIAMCIF